MRWGEAADLINNAYPRAIAEKTVTYDFARQMPGAKTVSTSARGPGTRIALSLLVRVACFR